MKTKNPNIYAKVREQCPVCGEIYLFEGVYKPSHLRKIEQGQSNGTCRCGQKLQVLDVKAHYVMGCPAANVESYLATGELEA